MSTEETWCKKHLYISTILQHLVVTVTTYPLNIDFASFLSKMYNWAKITYCTLLFVQLNDGRSYIFFRMFGDSGVYSLKMHWHNLQKSHR